MKLIDTVTFKEMFLCFLRSKDPRASKTNEMVSFNVKFHWNVVFKPLLTVKFRVLCATVRLYYGGAIIKKKMIFLSQRTSSYPLQKTWPFSDVYGRLFHYV